VQVFILERVVISPEKDSPKEEPAWS
jgi:hypothetical protein